MKGTGKRARWIAIGLLAIALLATAGWWWRATQVRAVVVAVLPARPALDGFGSELGVRLARVERRARSLGGAIAGLAELARLYHANGFMTQAGACERALMAIDPSNPLWPYLRAHTLGGYGDLEAALPLLQRTVELAPEYLPAQIRLGDVLFKQNETAGAAAVYRAALRRAPGETWATLGLARTELAAGRSAAAQQLLQHLVAAQPEFAPAWALLIGVDEQRGHEAAAATHRLQARNAGRPHEMPDPWIDDLMADCYDPYRLAVAAAAADPANHQARARQLLERAVAIAPNYDLPCRLLGNLLSDLGALAPARRYLERATVNNPKNPDNWSHLVRVLKAMGDMPAAGRALETGLAHCPEAPVLHLERGRRLAAAGRLDAAAAAFTYAQRLRPGDATAGMELAQVHFKQGRLEAGVAELRQVVKIDPGHPIATVLLARYAISQGNAAVASEWIEQARRQPQVPPGDLKQVIEEFRQQFGRMP